MIFKPPMNISRRNYYDKTIKTNSEERILKLYNSDKSFRNMSDTIRLFSVGLSKDLNAYINDEIDFNEFKRRALGEGVSLNSINNDLIPLIKEDINEGIHELKETINSSKPQKLTLYRGFTTNNKYKIDDKLKISGLSAFTTNKDNAISFSLAPTRKQGDSVIVEYSGNIKALNTKMFSPYKGASSENEFITNSNLKVNNIEKQRITHKNTGHEYDRYFIKMLNK